MPHISERAEKFAKTLIKPKPPVDNRSVDEKMATFSQRWGNMDSVRRRVKEARNAR